jgi:hypothetical protein
MPPFIDEAHSTRRAKPANAAIVVSARWRISFVSIGKR